MCAAITLSALIAAQPQERPLSYHGWALGISLDSAKTLTKMRIGRPLVCVGKDTKTMFCQTSHGSAHASLYFSPVPRRLEEMTLEISIGRRADRDSLEEWFRTRWGPPLPRIVVNKKSPPRGRTQRTMDVIGSWARPGSVFGMVAVSAADSVQRLSVSINSPARQLRLSQERSAASRKRR
ncbi:MAG: hypothetical protein PVSMB1_12260 [Gemmatimonadaceae bacterium]